MSESILSTKLSELRNKNENTLKVLLYLFTRDRDVAFSAEVVQKNCGILEIDMEKTLSLLNRLKVISKKKININGEDSMLYNFNPRHELIAILALCNEYIYHANYFALQSDKRHKPYLSKAK